LETKHFKVEVFNVCHSVPDALGIYFETVNGRIITTGDFRFDFEKSSEKTDINKIAELGLRGIDVLLCESTNSERAGFSQSEENIIKELRRLIKTAKGRVFLSVFASNLDRAEQILSVALENKRKICLLGRSMKNNIGISRDIKYLNIPNE
jgi:ribonuclease J